MQLFENYLPIPRDYAKDQSENLLPHKQKNDNFAYIACFSVSCRLMESYQHGSKHLMGYVQKKY